MSESLESQRFKALIWIANLIFEYNLQNWILAFEEEHILQNSFIGSTLGSWMIHSGLKVRAVCEHTWDWNHSTAQNQIKRPKSRRLISMISELNLRPHLMAVHSTGAQEVCLIKIITLIIIRNEHKRAQDSWARRAAAPNAGNSESIKFDL